MTIAEKVTQSANSALFTLYKEGLFYKCYNEDAMLFVEKVRAFKVSVKFVKCLREKVYSVGFPTGEVDKGKLSFEEISTKIESQGFQLKKELVIFCLNNSECKQNYNEWVEIQRATTEELGVKEPETIYSNTINSERILALIRNYDLANSTPMQSMHFIHELKNKLSKIEV